MENLKISIVIPTAECEGKKFLPRCLDSIKNQNYKNYEVLVMDEGKVAHNMNQGIKKATGDIIKIL
ncbi:MAG: glycosyltransferase, partial [Nanoarchaeota archaeon]